MVRDCWHAAGKNELTTLMSHLHCILGITSLTVEFGNVSAVTGSF